MMIPELAWRGVRTVAIQEEKSVRQHIIETTTVIVNILPAVPLLKVFILLILVCEKIFTQQRSHHSGRKALHNSGEELHDSHRNDSG
jgi:hypothetical protein